MTTTNEGTQRDELARDIFLADNNNASAGVAEADWEALGRSTQSGATYAHNLADAILAAGYQKPRTVATFEELDALPDGAVIVDVDKNAHRALKRTGGTNWWNAALTYTDSTAIALPAMLLGVAAND